MKQMGAVMVFYREDWHGWNSGIWANGSDTGLGSFFWVITKYAQTKLGEHSRNIFKCPSAPWCKQRLTSTRGSRSHDGYAYNLNETGWSSNEKINGVEACFAWPFPDTGVKRPTEEILIAEACGWESYGVGYGGSTAGDNTITYTSTNGWGWSGPHPSSRDEPIPVTTQPVDRWGCTHSKIYNLRASHGGANFLYYDGHIVNQRMTYGRNWSLVR